MKQEFQVNPADPLKSYQFGKKFYYQTVPSADEVLQSKKFRKFSERILRDSQQSENQETQDSYVNQDLRELDGILNNLTKAIEEKKLLEKGSRCLYYGGSRSVQEAVRNPKGTTL